MLLELSHSSSPVVHVCSGIISSVIICKLKVKKGKARTAEYMSAREFHIASISLSHDGNVPIRASDKLAFSLAGEYAAKSGRRGAAS